MFCLYCGETDEASSREHVLQSGLGGTLTIPGEVCHDCNTNVFSSIDDYFVTFVRKTCDPAARRRPWVLQDGVTLHYEQASGAWINLRFTKEGRPLLPPQLVLSRELDRALYCGADERFQDAVPQFLEELTGPEHLRVTKMVVDDTGMDPPLTPALIRSAPGCIAVRATDQEQSEEGATRLRAGRYRLVDVSVGPTRSIEQPEVTGRLSFNLDLIARALAKNSLNLLCAARGKEVALQGCYDSLRVFARNDEGDPDDFLIVPWSAEKGIQPKPELPFLSRPEHHTGVLFATHGAVWAAGRSSVWGLLWSGWVPMRSRGRRSRSSWTLTIGARPIAPGAAGAPASCSGDASASSERRARDARGARLGHAPSPGQRNSGRRLTRKNRVSVHTTLNPCG